MDENKCKRTDLDIASAFDRLFNEVPEPNTDEEVRTFLEKAGYDMEKLRSEGMSFVKSLIAGNWRFADLRDIQQAGAEINAIPLRKGWNRDQLTSAIEKLSAALSASRTQPSLAFRNLGELTNDDLATILQELEFTAHRNGITLDLD